MPAAALSRVGTRVVESGPGGGQELAAGVWQKLEALPDPRSRRGRIYPLARLVAVALCAFTAAGNGRLTAAGQWIKRASRQDLARLHTPWDPMAGRYRAPDEKTIRVVLDRLVSKKNAVHRGRQTQPAAAARPGQCPALAAGAGRQRNPGEGARPRRDPHLEGRPRRRPGLPARPPGHQDHPLAAGRRRRPTWPPSAPPSSRPSKTPATCTSPKAAATTPPPPKPSTSTASINPMNSQCRCRQAPGTQGLQPAAVIRRGRSRGSLAGPPVN